MKYDSAKVSKFVDEMDKKQFTSQELQGIGKVIIALAEVQKETEMLDEYLQSMQLNTMDVSGGNFN